MIDSDQCLNSLPNSFNLICKKNAKALSYLRERGLTDKTIEEWRIGYTLPDWRTAYDFLLTKVSDKLIWKRLGSSKSLTKKVLEQILCMTDFVRVLCFHCLIHHHEVIGYSGRIFGVPDFDGPKYLNSPDTVLFNKSETLYGYHKAKDGIRVEVYNSC